MSLKTTFFFTTPSFSGASQLNIGPFFVGFVDKFYKVEVHGQVNYQGELFGSSSVLVNFPAWGVQQIPQGSAAADVITSFDGDAWFIRRQLGQDDNTAAWAPSTDTSAVLITNTLVDRWAGQLAVGGDTDVWFSMKSANGSALPNLNVFGTIRLWWN